MLAMNLSHKVYCDVSFKELVDLLRGYLASKKFKASSSTGYEVVKHKHFEFYDAKYLIPSSRASIMISIARSVSLSFGETVFNVGNLRRDHSQGKLEFEELPLGVRQRFSHIPNYIEMSTSHKGMYKMQIGISEEFCTWMQSKGKNVFVSTFEGEYLDILSSAYDDPEITSNEINKLMISLSMGKGVPALDLSLYPNYFYQIVPYLTKDSILAIKTGEMIETMIPDLPDYSAVIIEYCKVVEIEIEDKILKPLKAHWDMNSRPDIVIPGVIKPLNKYLFGSSQKKLELGTFATQLEESLKCTNNPISDSLIEKIQALPLTIDAASLIDSILFISRTYRNPAAHKSILNKEDLIECKKIIFGTESSLGFLPRLINTQ